MVTPTSVQSTSDGSVVISVDMNVSDAEKELARLKKNIEKTEKTLEDATKKREKAQQVLSSSSLEEEKKKLSEMKEAYKQNTAVQKDLLRIKNEVDNIQIKIAQAEAKKTEELKKQQSYYPRILELQEKIAQLKESPDVNAEQIKGSKLSLRSYEAQFNAADKKIREYNASLLTYRKDLDALVSEEEKIIASSPKIEASETSIKKQEETVKKLQSEWNKAEKDVQKYDEKINDATAQLTAQTDQAADLQRQIAETEKEVSKLEVSDQRIVDLNKELLELKERQKELEGLGAGLGYEEYDQNAARIAEITNELKEYKNAIKYSGEDTISRELEELSAKAEEVNNRLTELANKYVELRTSESGIAMSEEEFTALRQEIKECVVFLDQLAESGQLSSLSTGANIARDRIADLNKTIEDYEHRLDNLDISDETAEVLSAKIERGKQMLEAYENELAKIIEQQSRIESEPTIDEGAQNRLNAYMEKSNSLYRNLNDMLGKVSELSGALQDIASLTSGEFSRAFSVACSSLGGFATEISAAMSAAAPYVAVALSVVAALKKLVDFVSEFGKKASSGFISGFKTVLSAGATAAQNFGNALQTIGKFGASSIKAIAGISKNVVDFAKSLNPIPKLIDAVQAKVKRLGQMIRRVFVFSVITSGLRNIRSQISAFLNLNTEFTTALRRLQGALLTAFQPIYDVIVPALTTLINVLTHAIAVITQFFASLFGTTAKRAQANAEALYNQASATTAAGEAAEEASKQLAAFDEINKLEGSGGEGGGGGATSVDMGPLFDYEYDETEFDNWGEAFSAFLDNLLDGIPKLREAFKDFADWLNDLAQKLYDMFTYPGVEDKVKQLGKELADALNDLTDWIDWDTLGRALGAGLDLAIKFLNDLIYNYNWVHLGESLAEAINGLVDEIDGYELGRLLWAPFKIAFETLAGFIYGLNMPLMTQTASDVILGFFDEMKNTVDLIKWEVIGDQIATFLNNIKWYEIITHAWDAISSAINALFRMVRSFIDKLEWDDIADQISRGINDSIGKVKWGDIGETIGDAIERAFNFLKTIVERIHWHEIGENIAEFILKFDFPSALGSLADLIAAGINAAMELACGLIDKIMPEANNIAKEIAERIRKAVASVEWAHLGEVVGNGIKTALSFVAGLIDPNLFYQIGKAIGDFLINLNWPGIVGGLAQVLANAIASAISALRGFLDSVKPHLKQVAEDIAQKINDFVHNVDWKTLGKTINEGINTALDFLLDILHELDWGSIGDAIVDFLSALDWPGLLAKWQKVLGTAIAGVLNSIDLSAAFSLGMNLIGGLIKGAIARFTAEGSITSWIKRIIFQPFIDGFKSLFGIHSPSTVMAELGGFIIEGLLQGIIKTWQNIVNFFSTAFEGIKQTITTAWETVKTATSTVWESIKNTLSTTCESLKQLADTAFNGVKENIYNAWETVKNATSSVWDFIKGFLSETWENIKESATTAFNGIKEKISKIWDSVKEKTSSIWENIKAFLQQTWDNIKELAKIAFDLIKQTISTAWENIKEKTSSIWESIKSLLKQIWDNLKSTAETAFNAIKEKIVTIWNAVKSDTSAKWNEIKTTLINLWTELKTTASNKFNDVKQSIIDKISELKKFDWAGIGKSIVDGIVSGLQTIWNNLKSWATNVKDTITGAFSGVASSVKSTFSATSGYGSRTYSIQSMPDIGNFEIPALAKGAVIPPNREFMAVLGDQKNGTNIEAPLATIEQAVANVMSRMNMSGNNRSQTVVLEVDGREFGRAVVNFGDQEYQRIGVRLVEART